MTDYSQANRPPGFWVLFLRNSGVIPLVLLVVTVVLTLMSSRDLTVAMALEVRGVIVEGTVLRRESRRERSGDSHKTVYFLSLIHI